MNIRRTLVAAAAALLLASCSKVTQENFNRITDGMTEQEVVALLGEPTESQSISVLGVSGSAQRWVGKDAVITVQFVNGKARLRFYDKIDAKK
jgi:hypothetical protein